MSDGACGLAGASSPLTEEALACMVHARQHAPRSEVSMSPLDGATLARFAFGMLLWEGTFRVVQAAVLRRREGQRSASREERELWHTSVPSYVVSTLHALLLCWCVRSWREAPGA